MTNKEALEILTHNWTKLVNPDYTDKELGQAQDLAIEALEERPKGKWLTHQTGYLLWEECDQCRYDDCATKYNFCPNCGADMRGD